MKKIKLLKSIKRSILPDGILYEYLAKDYFIIISGLIVKKIFWKKKIILIKNLTLLEIMIL